MFAATQARLLSYQNALGLCTLTVQAVVHLAGPDHPAS
jgi:hypothetical protein